MVCRPKCSMRGCNNFATPRSGKDSKHKDGTRAYRKYCATHRRKKYDIPQPMGQKAKMNIKLPRNKCVLCGWTGPCDHHHLKARRDGGKVIQSNLIVMCPNCHRLMERGMLCLS